MRICVISSSIFSIGQAGMPILGYGGLEAIAYYCAKGLAERGHQVTVIAPQGSQVPGCDVVQCLPPGYFNEEQCYSGCSFKDGNGEDVKWPGYWPKLLEFNDGVIIDHSVAGSEYLLVKIDGKARWTSFESLYEWAHSANPVIFCPGGSSEVPVNNLEVLSAGGTDTIRWCKVHSVTRHRKKDSLVRVKTRGGHSVIVTSGHSIIVAGRGGLCSVEAYDSVGRSSAIARSIPTTYADVQHWPVGEDVICEAMSSPYWRRDHKDFVIGGQVSLSDEDLVFLGLWIGDGCYDGGYGVCVDAGEETAHIGDVVAKKFGASCKKRARRDTREDVRWRINSSLLVKIMKRCGFDGYSDTKRFPDWVFDLSQRQIGLVLRGYFSSDGCVGKRLSVASASEQLSRQTMVLLSMCGIAANLYYYANKRANSYCVSPKPMWDVQIPTDYWKTFQDKVGFVQSTKQDKLEQNVGSPRRSWRGEVPLCLLEGKPLRQRVNPRGKVVSLSRIARFVGEEESDKFEQSPISWREILEIEDTGREDEYVYDLSVPGPENFFVGLVCCHNSWNKWSYMLAAEGRLKSKILGIMHAPINTMYASLPPVEHPRMVCISEDQKVHFDALHSPRVARVVRNGIDLDFYRSLGVPRTNRFLFLARFSSIKGPDIAIQACRNTGAGLDLVGDTTITQEPDYYNQCVSLCDGNQLKIIGNIPRGNAVWWYSQAHAMLHPNLRFREPLGLAPLESQACGTPIISFDHGAMRETVRNNETGFLVRTEAEFTEAVKQHMQPIPDFVRKRCVEWAGEFSIGKMVRCYEDLCQRALDGEGW